MFRTLLVFLVLLIGSTVESAKIKDFKLVCLGECPQNLSELAQDSGVIIKFWHLRCRVCLLEIPDALKAAEKKGVKLYLVNVGDSVKSVKRYLKSKGEDWPVLFDGSRRIAMKYNVQVVPMTFYINRDKDIVHVVSGSDKTLIYADKIK